MNKHNIINLIQFQVGWFVCVTYANKFAWLVAALALLLYGFSYLQHRNEWLMIVAVVILGILFDSLMGQLGVLKFVSPPLPPFWLMTLWLLFATTLLHSLRYFIQRPPLFMLFSAIGGTLSYFIGVRVSAIEFGFNPWISIVILATSWCVIGAILSISYAKWFADLLPQQE